MEEQDKRFMRMAIELARKGMGRLVQSSYGMEKSLLKAIIGSRRQMLQRLLQRW